MTDKTKGKLMIGAAAAIIYVAFVVAIEHDTPYSWIESAAFIAVPIGIIASVL